MVVHACNPSTGETEAQESKAIFGYTESLRASLDYVRPCYNTIIHNTSSHKNIKSARSRPEVMWVSSHFQTQFLSFKYCPSTASFSRIILCSVLEHALASLLLLLLQSFPNVSHTFLQLWRESVLCVLGTEKSLWKLRLTHYLTSSSF